MAINYQAQGRICNDCHVKRNAVESAAAAEVSAAEDLPKLEGSEKQVAWAETIRRRIIDDIREWLPFIASVGSRAELHGMTQEQRKARSEQANIVLAAIPDARRAYVNMQALSLLRAMDSPDRCGALLSIMAKQSKASWWIDNRATGPEQLAEMFLSAIAKAEAERAADPVAAEIEKQLEADVMAEALLLPPTAPNSPIIAEISYSGGYVRVAFAERNYSFNAILRGEEYGWSATARAWVRHAEEPHASDRMAEIAHRILAAGYQVRMHDTAARERAITGSFNPEQRRWIKRGKGGKFDGWFQITWPKRDDFYDVSRAIRGSKYASRAVYIQPQRFDEVADFAERHGFSISEAAQGVIDHYRAVRAAGIVIAEPVIPSGEVGSSAPAALQLYDFEVADEFLDD